MCLCQIKLDSHWFDHWVSIEQRWLSIWPLSLPSGQKYSAGREKISYLTADITQDSFGGNPGVPEKRRGLSVWAEQRNNTDHHYNMSGVKSAKILSPNLVRRILVRTSSLGLIYEHSVRTQQGKLWGSSVRRSGWCIILKGVKSSLKG